MQYTELRLFSAYGIVYPSAHKQQKEAMMREYLEGLQRRVEKWINEGKDPEKRRQAIDCLLADLLFADQSFDLGDNQRAVRFMGEAFRLAQKIGIIKRHSRMFCMW